MKSNSPGFIVSEPVKCNQANQTVKKCSETSFVALFRMQIYEGDKSSWRKKKVKRYQYNKVGDCNEHIYMRVIYEGDKSSGQKKIKR